jgi:hypothetical protein
MSKFEDDIKSCTTEEERQGFGMRVVLAMGKRIEDAEADLKAKSHELLRLTCANANLTHELTELRARIADLFPMIAHGDAEHRRWLKEAIDEHFADTTAEDTQE